MTNIKNKIEAADQSIEALLKDQKFFIDYFQREYRWQERHMEALVEDLTTAFLQSYNAADKRSKVGEYQSYYLGPVVFSIADGKNSIIDGQQRITSITLFLIYLKHLQVNSENKVSIDNLIFSEKYGEKSFNMTDKDRQDVLQGLYDHGEYTISDNEEETIQNIVQRYADIHKSFPEEIDAQALPYFIDWFIGNVILVKITAYSDENAYTIFETMNDRGMSLTSTEMLKGYVLSRMNDRDKRARINNLWKASMLKLHAFDESADLDFFKAWFRAKYAITVRPRKADSENQDFEQIGTRFHDWFKTNHQEKINIASADEFFEFFEKEFVFMMEGYCSIRKRMQDLNKDTPHLFYMDEWGIASSLQDALLLAPLNSRDNPETTSLKLDAVARFIETYTVRRAVNFRKFGASAIQYTFFNIIKNIRNLSYRELCIELKRELDEMPETFEEVSNFYLHQQNRRFVKHVLCRITAFVDQSVGRSTNYSSYQYPEGKPFEIEHIWADKFELHKDEFEQEWEFSNTRNAIGALILLPNGTNQSFSSDVYEAKLPHYLKENTYAQTLHPDFYFKNPNYKNSSISAVSFRAHSDFKKEDIYERTEVVKELCRLIWSTEWFENRISEASIND